MTAASSLPIGVVGHRPGRLTAPQAVATDIAALLDRAAAAGAAVTVITALAEGADRIAAHQARMRSLPLQVVLPFARQEYEKDFPDSAAEFADLLQGAASITELPGQRQDAPAAYEAASREILSRAKLLIAVWDGGPSGGRGGTTESIEQAQAQQLPVLWVDATGQMRPVSIPPEPDLQAVLSRAATAR